MKLLTKTLRQCLPPLYTTENDPDPKVICHFFTPDSSWDWYALEFDGEDIFFGLADGFVVELGYFSLKEFQGASGKRGLPVERDLHFKPIRLSEVKARLQAEGKQVSS